MPGFIHLKKKIYFIYVMRVRERVYAPLQVPEEARGWCLGTGVTGSCEPLDVDAVDKTLFLWENSNYCYPLSQVSSLHSSSLWLKDTAAF